MQRINHMLTPGKPASRWGFLRTIAAVAVITAGSLGTMALTDSAIAQDRAADTTQDRSKTATEASMKITDVVLRVTNALANGEISSTQAAEFILAAQQKIKTAEAFAAHRQAVIAAVKAGAMTRQAAGVDMAAFKKQLDAQLLSDFKTRMQAAIKSGTMSKEEVRQVWSTHQAMAAMASKTITRADYAAAQAKMTEQVAAGELTEAQMKEKLAVLRKMIGKAKVAGDGSNRANYAAAQAKMTELVAAGELTEAQMNEKLSAMREMIAKAHNAGKAVTREDYAQAHAKMQAMVEAGELTEAQMKEKLVDLRKMIGKAKGAGGTITRADYADAQAAMQKMVDAGKITKEQMDARLGEMRKMIGSGRGEARRGGERANGGDGRGISDECMALRRRLGAAVTNGEMTREEAGEIWQAEGCGR